MADVSITPANVAMLTGSAETGTAGETITQGEAVYRKDSDGRMWLADNDGAAALAVVKGVALNCASAGQPLRFQKTGTLTIGGTVTQAGIYVLSDTAGGIAPAADLDTTGMRVSIIGVAASATVLQLGINNTGITVP